MVLALRLFRLFGEVEGCLSICFVLLLFHKKDIKWALG